jgi:hypothetical protein
MKKIFSLIVILSVVFASFIPVFSQKPGRTGKSISTVSNQTTGFADAQSFSEGRGVFIKWRMDVETDNVGFNVYRLGTGGPARSNDGMILGSKAHYGTEPAYGESYSYFDPNGSLGDVFYVEAVDSAGVRVSSGKFGVSYVEELRKVAGASSDELIARDARRKAPLTNSELTLPKDVQTVVESSQLVPDPVNQKIIAAKDGVKLGIKSNGFYRVTRAELQTAGFNVNAAASTWQLFCDGVEQAINVPVTGDYVEFLGKAQETIESDQRYYYLIVGDTDGKRMATRVLRPFGSPTVTQNYDQTFFAKQRIYYISTILNGDAENFWGGLVYSTPSTFNFNLSGVDFGAGDATVFIKFQGFSTTPHTISLALNGQPLPTVTSANDTPFSTLVTVPASALIEGTNSLQMTAGVSNDYSLFDSISVSYKRKFQADQNQIPFYTINYRGARVTGFTSPNVRLFDTTLDGDPAQLLNLNIVQNGASYDLVLPPNRGRTMLAVEDSAIKSADSITRNIPSALSTPAHNADLVIITYGAFMTQAQNWANYRTLQGFNVQIVDVVDIFDEFGYGQPGAASINAFLQYACTSWQTAPQYALLLGDASYDPKNYEGHGYLNLVPTKIVNTLYEETGSDEALADFNGDGLAELSIGRIPALTGQVVTDAFNKVQAFETPAMQDLNRGAIFAYDLPSGYDFGAMSATLRANLPGTMPVVMVDRGAANSQATLISEINNGRYIVNYSGHGSTGLWGAVSFFSSNNVPSLTNANSQSIFTMLTCLNGYFLNPSDDSLSEKLLKAQNGGAVATWASTGKTTPDIQLIMGNRFYNQLAVGNITRMGDLIRDAKSVLPGSSDVRYSWALLGDPMLKVR